jgi:hypothetical protein
VRFFARDNLFTRVFYSYVDRDFFLEDGGAPQLDRDGQVLSGGIDQYFLVPDFRGWGTSFVRVSLRYRDEDSQGNNYDSHGPIGLLSFGVALPEETFLLIEGWYERRKFDHPSIFSCPPGCTQPAAGDRSDRISQIRVGLRRQLNANFSLSGGWRYIHWSSNVATYDYDRHISDIRLTYRY